MKHLLVLFFIFILITFMTYSQNLNVTSPHGGESWEKGTSHNITWSSTGCTNPDIKINIFKNSIDQANFVEQLTASLSDGSKRWTISENYVPGNYILRIKTADNICIGDSGLFMITGQTSNGIITITNPHSGTVWLKGSIHNITWTSSDCTNQNVKINIFRNSVDQANFIEQLSSTLNTGYKSWAINNNYIAGNYIIRIKTADNIYKDDSEMFTISEQPDIPESIKLISPTSMWSFNAGGNMTIKWRSSGISGKGLVIRLVSKDNLFNVIIKDNHPYDASPLLWTIPDNIGQGKYHIDITKEEITAQSGNFTINKKTSRISVSSPLGGVTKLKGKVCSISWHSSNINSNKVLIKLNPKSGSLAHDQHVINGNADNREGRNNYSWTIPGQVPDGKYRVSVEKKDGSAKGESKEFTIAGNRGCDLAIESAEFCSGKLNVTIKNNGDHYSGKITLMLIYDMFGKTRVSIPVIVKKNFILFSGKTLTLTEKTHALYNAVYSCSMNYILLLIPDKDHKDTNGGNNQYNGVAYKDCDIRECNKPDLWFEKVWVKKKYHNSVVHTGKKLTILAELHKTGKNYKKFTTRVVVYYYKKQFDPWARVTENRWWLSDFGNKKELSFTFVPDKEGNYIFEWVTDIHNDVAERNENNNKKGGYELIRDPR
ncbi:MAG: hypothetical protein KAR14_04355 [Candidatus Aminicenantes bacterium]|nr:hypothetical protein [Candidatus Aminicenantes bacterium]